MTTGRINQVTTLAVRTPARHRPSQRRRLPFGNRSNAELMRLARRSSSKYRTYCHRLLPESDPRTAVDNRQRDIENGFFVAPPGHSLRGRDTQDGRVHIESRPVRIDHSRPRYTHRRVLACRTRTVRASLGRASSMSP